MTSLLDDADTAEYLKLTPGQQEEVQERAGIIEYGAGMSRLAAETLAVDMVKARYRNRPKYKDTSACPCPKCKVEPMTHG